MNEGTVAAYSSSVAPDDPGAACVYIFAPELVILIKRISRLVDSDTNLPFSSLIPTYHPLVLPHIPPPFQTHTL